MPASLLIRWISSSEPSSSTIASSTRSDVAWSQTSAPRLQWLMLGWHSWHSCRAIAFCCCASSSCEWYICVWNWRFRINELRAVFLWPDPDCNEDYLNPIIADADTGHGGITATMKLAKMFIENGAAGIHIEAWCGDHDGTQPTLCFQDIPVTFRPRSWRSGCRTRSLALRSAATWVARCWFPPRCEGLLGPSRRKNIEAGCRKDIAFNGWLGPGQALRYFLYLFTTSDYFSLHASMCIKFNACDCTEQSNPVTSSEPAQEHIQRLIAIRLQAGVATRITEITFHRWRWCIATCVFFSRTYSYDVLSLIYLVSLLHIRCFLPNLWGAHQCALPGRPTCWILPWCWWLELMRRQQPWSIQTSTLCRASPAEEGPWIHECQFNELNEKMKGSNMSNFCHLNWSTTNVDT